MFDRIFKVSLVLALFALTVAVWTFSSNGHYAFYEQKEGGRIVLNTRTGTVFLISGGGSVEINPLNGEIARHAAP